MSKREMYGSINFGYATRVLLPLEEAHKIQAILAKHATGVSMAYRSKGVSPAYYDDYAIPSVDVMEPPRFDCRGMTQNQKLIWADTIKNSEGDNILTPQECIALHGDTNE